MDENVLVYGEMCQNVSGCTGLCQNGSKLECARMVRDATE